jgi:restriction system protein
MRLKMSENSLFAILLRSPWWISIGLVGVFAVLSGALLPPKYVPFGVMGGFPFLVIGVMAAWRQWHAPSPKRVSDALERVSAMSWREFSSVIEKAYSGQGYAVQRLNLDAADFKLTKDGRHTLISCKRWKAAVQGVEGLRALATAQETHGAEKLVCIALGQPSNTASQYAREHGIQWLSSAELARLIS